MSDRLPEMQEIFRAVFDRPELEIRRELSARTITGWDSLIHITLIMSIEKRYKVRFALGEQKKLANVGDLLDLIDKKLAAK